MNGHSNTDTDVQILIALHECPIYDQEAEIVHAYYLTTYQWENTRGAWPAKSRFILSTSNGTCVRDVGSVLEFENLGGKRHPTNNNSPLFYIGLREFSHSFSTLQCISTLQC